MFFFSWPERWGPTECPSLGTKAGSDGCNIPFGTTEEDQEEDCEILTNGCF